MPNNQQLPQPNLPKIKSKNQKAAKLPKSNLAKSKLPKSGMGAQKQNLAKNTNQGAPTVPAGLDPNNPGGSPPPLDNQGRVQGTAANISQNVQKKQYGNGSQPHLGQSASLPKSKKPASPAKILSQAKEQPNPAQGQAPPKAKTSGQPAAINKQINTKKAGVGGKPLQGPQQTIQGKIPTGGKPVFANSKKSAKKILPFILAGVVVVAVVGFLISRILGGSSSSESKSIADNSNKDAPAKEEVILSYWGLWEPSSVFEGVLQEFEEKNPGIKVNYLKKSHKDYRSRLQTAISSGNGPDLFRFHATWTPMFSRELAAMPSKIMSVANYEKAFYPIVSSQLQLNGQIVGVPIMYDGLALYYNKDILESANEEAPKTWGELKLLASKLTVKNNKIIERGGLAIGNTTNVQHWSDILGLLIYQNGGNPSDPISSEVRDAIKFYVSFAQDSPVYSTSLPSSTVAFAREEAAMIFAPSWRVHEIKDMNPDLDFGVSAVPKLSEQEYGWASYWAEGVSNKSKHKEEAWTLLQYLSSESVMKKLFSQQSQLRAFGEIYARKDMADAISNELITAYLIDAPKAKSWYLCSFTHDDGLNDKMIEYYKDATEEFLAGGRTEDVLKTLDQGVKQVLRQYGSD
ncbi:MAG: sugar ABC transporter substrate-binding protein [Patescibacteria group bacterium]|nr:sugar ABC transporter substrate-binding protein [Patescibacteria group bacterium]